MCRHAHSLFASDYWVHINKVQPAQQIKMQYSGQEAEERKAICSILFYIYLVECSSLELRIGSELSAHYGRIGSLGFNLQMHAAPMALAFRQPSIDIFAMCLTCRTSYGSFRILLLLVPFRFARSVRSRAPVSSLNRINLYVSSRAVQDFKPARYNIVRMPVTFEHGSRELAASWCAPGIHQGGATTTLAPYIIYHLMPRFRRLSTSDTNSLASLQRTRRALR